MFYFTVDVGSIIIREINVWNGIICWGIHKIQLSNDIGKVYRYLTESGIHKWKFKSEIIDRFGFE